MLSPLSGLRLRPDGDGALVAPGERWPVVDGIPYLRVGRAALVDACLDALDRGDAETATALLLQDRDDWAPGDPPGLDACRAAVRARDHITFRDAMGLLAFGPVADYLAHRWSDPTFLSGLALAEAYWTEQPRVVEIACGTGAFLRAFAPHAAAVTGLDVAFAKLWLARHWIVPESTLICCDAAAPWPIASGGADIVFCHDAFYFLPEKAAVARRLRDTATRSGRVLVGHVHNAFADNLSAGAPVSPGALQELFPGAALYDDAELTRALLDRRAPSPPEPDALSRSAALSLALAPTPPAPLSGLLDLPAPGTRLRRNPLYAGGELAALTFPSARYAAEYGPLTTCPPQVVAPLDSVASGDDEPLVRQRVLIDLPPRW